MGLSVCIVQELKGKIILKGKKMGCLEDSLNGRPEEVPAEDSDDEDGPETEEELLRNEDKKKEKVCGHPV